MALRILSLLLLLSSHTTVLANEQKTWCVAKPSSSDAELQDNVDYACQVIDCGAINPGGPCVDPNTLVNHASVVMNLFYQQHGRQPHTCFFENSALVSITDPSYGGCKYPYYSE